MCKCMAADADWKGAAYMPYLDTETKGVVIKPFQAARLRRIGQIRAELRRRQWWMIFIGSDFIGSDFISTRDSAMLGALIL